MRRRLKFELFLGLLLGFLLLLQVRGQDVRELLDRQIDAMVPLVTENPDSMKTVLGHLQRTAEAAEYTRGQARILWLLAEIYQQQGHYDSSLNAISSALDMAGDIPMPGVRVRLYTCRGSVFYDMSEYDQAYASYTKAESLAQTVSDSLRLMTEISLGYGNIVSRRGQYAEAIRHYLNAAEVFEQLEQPNRLAVAYNNIATEYSTWEQRDKAIEYFTRAAELNTSLGDEYNLSMNYANIGVEYKKMDSTNIALEYYHKSLEIAKRLGITVRIAQNYINIGNILKHRSEYAEAEEYLSSALEICRDSNIRYGILLGHVNLGGSYFLQKDYSTALAHYDSALVLAKELALPREQYQVLEHMFEVRYAQGEYQQAIEHLQSYHMLRDSLHNERARQQVQELQVKYETEQTEKENALLRQDREVQAALLRKNRIILLLVGIGAIGTIGFLLVLYRSRRRIKKVNQEVTEKNAELEAAISRIKVLQGLLPICSHCKKIRDDEGYWQNLEEYISHHSDATFTHGICPDCMVDLYPGYTKDT